MKKSIKIICLMLLAQLFTSTIRAQAMLDSVSILISPGTDNPKKISDVRAYLKATSGIRIVAYCTNHNVFMLYMDTKIYGSAVEFAATAASSSGVSTLILKRGKVSEMMNFCTFEDAAEAALIKQSTH